MVDLKGFMLSEINNIEKDKYHIILLTCDIQKQTYKTETILQIQRRLYLCMVVRWEEVEWMNKKVKRD